eukprot:scaffold4247_cov66-Cylindrotheca_fusiformis.AAC.20
MRSDRIQECLSGRKREMKNVGAKSVAIVLLASLYVAIYQAKVSSVASLEQRNKNFMQRKANETEQTGSIALLEQSNKKVMQREANETKRTGSIPSAKMLLTKPQPFTAPQMIKLSDSLIESPNTVVTAYHRLPSKHTPEEYDEWMKNMLSLQDAMVIFTEAAMVHQIKEHRQHALNRTVIVPLELEDLPIGTLYTRDFWQDQLDRDPEKSSHRSFELFWIWLSKSWYVSQAIDMNVFGSDLFMWSDIGCFRDELYNSKTMILHRELVPPHEMMQMAVRTPNPPRKELFNNKYKHRENLYHSGSQAVAFRDTWGKFHEYFLDTIDRFLARGMIIVEDQAVLQSTCLSHPEICVYVPFTEVQDISYFGLRYVLHEGGSFKLWRYVKAIDGKKSKNLKD